VVGVITKPLIFGEMTADGEKNFRSISGCETCHHDHLPDFEVAASLHSNEDDHARKVISMLKIPRQLYAQH
jgi:hypothetical protein